MSYTYEYPRPALTVDCVIFGLDEQLEYAADLIEVEETAVLPQPAEGPATSSER